MPRKLRSDIINPDVVGVYHCWNRLVRQRHLFGFDFLTGKDFSYRKNWVRDRLKELAGCMAIDVLDYAILDNHLHVVLRNRPDIVATWSDEEVAQRWWNVCPLRRDPDGSPADPLPAEIRLFMADADDYRKRLSSISWLMRLLCQPIGRRANQEDGVEGRFFAKPFDCVRLESEADLLACSIYVDLNAIHANIVNTPEESKFTSAFERIQARWRQTNIELESNSASSEGEGNSWLAPIHLNEAADAYTGIDSAAACNPVGSARISNKGFLPLKLEQYLSLVDVVGRMLRKDKRGRIPAELPPILERLKLDANGWIDSMISYFSERPTLQPGH